MMIKLVGSTRSTIYILSGVHLTCQRGKKRTLTAASTMSSLALGSNGMPILQNRRLHLVSYHFPLCRMVRELVTLVI